MEGFVHRPELRVKVIDPRATLPKYQTDLAAGLDISACLPESSPELTLAPGQIAIVPTGLIVAIPVGYEGQVRARSGLATRHGLGMPNSPGTIDADYRGELRIAVINFGREPFTITHGLRIAQLVISPVAHAKIAVVEELDETRRGERGFGSTGV